MTDAQLLAALRALASVVEGIRKDRNLEAAQFHYTDLAMEKAAPALAVLDEAAAPPLPKSAGNVRQILASYFSGQVTEAQMDLCAASILLDRAPARPAPIPDEAVEVVAKQRWNPGGSGESWEAYVREWPESANDIRKYVRRDLEAYEAWKAGRR